MKANEFSIKKIIILAAGKGTRLKNLTENTAKALVLIKDKPLIQHTLDIIPDQIEEIIIITKHFSEKIKELYGNKYKHFKIKYITQSTKYSGTYGALYSAKKLLKDEKLFCVLNCDDIYEEKELKNFISNNTKLIGYSNIYKKNYYNLLTNNKKDFLGFEKDSDKKNNTLSINIATGAYILDNEFFNLEPQKISNNEYGIPQTLEKNISLYQIKTYEFKNWAQINTPDDIWDYLNQFNQ